MFGNRSSEREALIVRTYIGIQEDKRRGRFCVSCPCLPCRIRKRRGNNKAQGIIDLHFHLFFYDLKPSKKLPPWPPF
jgi:hypothetical protein